MRWRSRAFCRVCGASGFSGSTSQPFTETILASSFTISLSPTTVALLPQTTETPTTATVAIRLASVGGFAGPLTLSYSALPQNGVASLQPSVVTLTAGGTASSTLTIQTVPPTLALSRNVRWPMVMAATLILFLPGRGRRWALRPGRRGRSTLWLALMVALLQAVTGCATVRYAAPTIAPGSYPVQVTAVDGKGYTQTASFILVIPAP